MKNRESWAELFQRIQGGNGSHWLTMAVFCWLSCNQEPKPEGNHLERFEMIVKGGDILLGKEKIFLFSAVYILLFGIWVAVHGSLSFRASQLHFK